MYIYIYIYYVYYILYIIYIYIILCIYIYPNNNSHREYCDLALDFEVPHVQTNPYIYIYLLNIDIVHEYVLTYERDSSWIGGPRLARCGPFLSDILRRILLCQEDIGTTASTANPSRRGGRSLPRVQWMFVAMHFLNWTIWKYMDMKQRDPRDGINMDNQY